MATVQAVSVHFSTSQNYAKCVTGKRAARPPEITDELYAKHLIGRCEKPVAMPAAGSVNRRGPCWWRAWLRPDTVPGPLLSFPGPGGAAPRDADAAGGTRGERVRRPEGR